MPLSTLAPERPFVAVGDIHGRADLLLDLDRQIAAHCAGWPVVLLGDYIDRGEQSREVLELLMTLSAEGTPPVTCLMGNHERMLLDFLDFPERRGPVWLRNGGLQTLASFGIAPPVGTQADAVALKALRARLADTMGEAMIAWLRARPLFWQSGNIWAVHAGADPDRPIPDQAADTLTWGHADFLRRARPDGHWVAHGHSIVDMPEVRDGRIALDTGAYATGRLTAAAIAAGDVRFFQTGPSR
ncbi:metallophosphoesterase [Roseovarius nitratireducens]|uniref:metallophosphoesterase n=1 Tax=Roseovarius nitratireducens TaxID=2044597 RepID=UPI001F0C18CB|nr:metallophosphoesterase [Roseovarius nitratireducens]